MSLLLENLDSFLATGGEERAGPVEYRVVENSGSTGSDSALLSLTEHILKHFEFYRCGIGTKCAQLAEALLTESFILKTAV